MKMKLLVGALAFLIVLNLATLGTWAYYQFRADGPERSYREEGMRRSPGAFGRKLDHKKREHLGRLMRTFREETRPLQQEIMEKHQELHVLLAADVVDSLQVDSLLREIAGRQADIQRRAIHDYLKAREFLSPEEQRALAATILRPGNQLRRFGRRGERK